MDDGVDHRPFASVISDAAGQFAALMRLDVRLFQTEMRIKASTVLTSGVCGMAAVVLFLLAAFALVQFVILAMIYFGVGAMLACFVVGAVLLMAGLSSLFMAKRALVGLTITPVETVNQVRSNLAALKQGIRYGTTQR
ncbi:phage holin family protein (plasmid) [Mesorhizobium sp. AR02]|uniref:phage holin family protein n=1 Tax=Mesorhizobium sp. AR02 TaxID=2865837 RepID=UPI0021610994|nr:phage holin family protein [Mesorhizobium sp. AR02]UVK57380.1 phage holin family protein [Mesorhizobium sp. AR02]